MSTIVNPTLLRSKLSSWALKGYTSQYLEADMTPCSSVLMSVISRNVLASCFLFMITLKNLCRKVEGTATGVADAAFDMYRMKMTANATRVNAMIPSIASAIFKPCFFRKDPGALISVGVVPGSFVV